MAAAGFDVIDLGVPTADPKPYEVSSLLGYVKELKRPLLLLHGTADDNVYFLHSLELADALFRAGRPFQLLPLAGATHISRDPEATERLWQRAAAFFREHL